MGGGGVARDQISDMRPPTKIKYQISQQKSDIWPLPCSFWGDIFIIPANVEEKETRKCCPVIQIICAY